MELKTVRQPLAVNETVYSGNGEIPVDEDFVLPDYYAEINKLLKCKVEGRITSKSVNTQSITVDGHLCINILYCDKNGQLHSFEQISPISRSFDTSCEITGATVEAALKTEYCNCRVVTERKISVHGALSICLKAIQQKKYDVVADITDDTLQIDRREFPALNSIGSAEKNLLIEEELVLSGGQPPIDGILRYCASPTVTEVKAVRNKAAVKGNLAVTVLYRCDKQCAVYKCSVPFSQLLDISGMNEDCICTAKAQLCYLEMTPRKGEGEIRSMMLNAKLAISVQSYCDDKIPVIIDAYSTEYELSMSKTDMNIEKILGHISDTYMFKNTLEFNDCEISNIIDSWTETEITGCTCRDGEITVNAGVNICILATNSDGTVSFYEKKVDMVYKKHTDFECAGNLKCDSCFEPVSVSFTLLSDCNVEYRIEYRVNLSLREENCLAMLTEISCDTKTPKQKRQDCSLIIYYAESGERVWDIAKAYNSDIMQMREINSLSSEVIDNNKRILIPLF